LAFCILDGDQWHIESSGHFQAAMSAASTALTIGVPAAGSPNTLPPASTALSQQMSSPMAMSGKMLAQQMSSPLASGSVRTGAPVKFGLAEPISLQEPSEADMALTERMFEDLQVAFPAETPEGMLHRQAVLQDLEKMVLDWQTDVGVEAGMPEEEARRCGVRLTTLGSYRLGVVHPGSDIDTLCIGPPHVSREDFFASFVERLSQHKQLNECVPIADAYTPIIKMKLRNVDIDLLFARLVRPLAEGETPEDLSNGDDVLKDMDEKSVRCINGFRVADQILKLVPNKETFRRTLRFIKFWARQRGIYSNVLGFFGGITWSLLTARVCQLYPYYAPSQLVSRFFRLYFQWNWTKPVMLNEIVDPMTASPGLTGFKVWNPKVNASDRAHIMPVITPAFPAMNSTHNVTETTKRILLDEFRRGYEATKRVETQNAPWSEVYEVTPFFNNYKHFLWVEILAQNEDTFKKFSGWVESKLRILTIQLEPVSGMIVHPNPVQYDMRGSDEEWPFGCAMFIGMAFNKEDGASPGITIDLRSALSQFLDVIDGWTEKEAHLDQYRLRWRRIRGSELPKYAIDPEAVKKPAKRPLNQGGDPVKKARLNGQ